MKKYFVTGLVILLPLALTIAIVAFIFNLLTTPFVGIVKSALSHYDLLDQGFLFLSAEEVQVYVSQIIILIILFFITVGLGFIARWFFFNTVIKIWDFILHRIPFVSTIYKTSQDVIKTIFASDTQSFKKVVMVPFPKPDTYAMGLVTRDNLPSITKNPDNKLVAVFVPTTPNPTSGFLMMYNEADLIHLDMKVEDAFKYIISCGVIVAPFKTISAESAKEKTIVGNPKG